MLLLLFTLAVVLISCVSGFSSKQRIDVGHPVTKLLNASASVAINQIQVPLQSQEPSSNTNETLKTSLGASNSEIGPLVLQGNQALSPSAAEHAAKGPVNAKMAQFLLPPTSQSSQTATTPPLINDSTSTPSSETPSAMIGTETTSRKTTFAEGLITSSLGAESTDLAALMFGSQTIKADDQSEYTQVNRQTSTPGSTTAAGSGTLPDIQKDSSPQSLLIPDPSSSLLSLIAGTSAVSKTSPPQTLKGQNIATNSIGQYNTNGQTLTPDTMTTVSGTTISVAPTASDGVEANSSHAPTANSTTRPNSGPTGTSVQIFKGGVPGAGDGLWSSSIALFVGIVVLLWL